MRQPFARVAFGDVRLRRQFRRRHGALLVERLVQAEPVADAHHGHAERAAEIAKNLADKLIEFSFVDHCRPRPDWFRPALASVIAGLASESEVARVLSR